MIRPGLGTVLFLAVKGFRQHAFSSMVASLTIALAAGLFLSNYKIKEEANRAFANASGGFDAVLGARGSKLQLILQKNNFLKPLSLSFGEVLILQGWC